MRGSVQAINALHYVHDDFLLERIRKPLRAEISKGFPTPFPAPASRTALFTKTTILGKLGEIHHHPGKRRAETQCTAHTESGWGGMCPPRPQPQPLPNTPKAEPAPSLQPNFSPWKPLGLMHLPNEESEAPGHIVNTATKKHNHLPWERMIRD